MNTTLMNHVLRRLLPVGVCAGLALCASRAEEKPAEPNLKLKVSKPATVKAPFLGLALGQVDEALSAQLNLPEGVGVLVRAVLPDSPAAKAGVLQHDVLHYFNDQLLVNESQLQTLVRQAGIGADVTLKLIRKGNESTVSVKLGEHEEREPADAMRGRSREPGEMPADHLRKYPPYAPFTPPFGGRVFNVPLNSDGFANQVRELSEQMKQLEGKPDEMRAAVERFQKEVQEQASKYKDFAAKQAEEAKRNDQSARAKGAAASSHGASKVWKDDKGGIRVEVRTGDDSADGFGSAGVTATADDKGNVTVTQTNSTRMAWSDGEGSGELLIENGKKKLSAKDKDGKQIFFGPVDTEEQLKGLPPGVRERLERIESKVKVDVRAGKPAGDL